jgi:hypothetical protein
MLLCLYTFILVRFFHFAKLCTLLHCILDRRAAPPMRTKAELRAWSLPTPSITHTSSPTSPTDCALKLLNQLTGTDLLARHPDSA